MEKNFWGVRMWWNASESSAKFSSGSGNAQIFVNKLSSSKFVALKPRNSEFPLYWSCKGWRRCVVWWCHVMKSMVWSLQLFVSPWNAMVPGWLEPEISQGFLVLPGAPDIWVIPAARYYWAHCGCGNCASAQSYEKLWVGCVTSSQDARDVSDPPGLLLHIFW